MQPLGGQDFLDDQVHNRFANVCLADVLIVLGRQYDRVDGHRLAVFIAQGYLAFGIRAQPWQSAMLAQFRLALYQAMGIIDRCGH